MGKYNFDEMTLRRGTNCVKWDAESPVGPISEDVIPLWVADMDFKVAPEIVDVLKKRVDQEIFGYTHVPDSYYDAAINWWSVAEGGTPKRTGTSTFRELFRLCRWLSRL